MPDNPEIGRELKASEIKVDTIVVIEIPGRDNQFCSINVVEVRHNMIMFFSPVMNWHFINLIDSDGDLKDYIGRVVHIYEYLGDP